MAEDLTQSEALQVTSGAKVMPRRVRPPNSKAVSSSGSAVERPGVQPMRRWTRAARKYVPRQLPNQEPASAVRHLSRWGNTRTVRKGVPRQSYSLRMLGRQKRHIRPIVEDLRLRRASSKTNGRESGISIDLALYQTSEMLLRRLCRWISSLKTSRLSTCWPMRFALSR